MTHRPSGDLNEIDKALPPHSQEAFLARIQASRPSDSQPHSFDIVRNKDALAFSTENLQGRTNFLIFVNQTLLPRIKDMVHTKLSLLPPSPIR